LEILRIPFKRQEGKRDKETKRKRTGKKDRRKEREKERKREGRINWNAKLPQK
jgi:hypothetical protein